MALFLTCIETPLPARLQLSTWSATCRRNHRRFVSLQALWPKRRIGGPACEVSIILLMLRIFSLAFSMRRSSRRSGRCVARGAHSRGSGVADGGLCRPRRAIELADGASVCSVSPFFMAGAHHTLRVPRGREHRLLDDDEGRSLIAGSSYQSMVMVLDDPAAMSSLIFLAVTATTDYRATRRHRCRPSG